MSYKNKQEKETSNPLVDSSVRCCSQ